MASALKLSGAVKELRILFSPINPSSGGVREFISKHYVSLRNNNPNVKFMLREGNSVNPCIYVRYNFGKESFVSVDNASTAEIMNKFGKLTTA